MSPKVTNLAVVALLLLSGCGDDDDGMPVAQSTGSTDKPARESKGGNAEDRDCLVSFDEVTAALPGDVTIEQLEVPGDPGDFALCEFRWEKYKQGTLEVRDYTGTANTLEASAPRQDTAIDVDGLGDRAYAQGTERSIELRVFNGDSAVVIAITQYPPKQNIAPRIDEWKADPLTAARELAEAAATRQS